MQECVPLICLIKNDCVNNILVHACRILEIFLKDFLRISKLFTLSYYADK